MSQKKKAAPHRSSKFFGKERKQLEGSAEFIGLSKYIQRREVYVLLFLIVSIAVIVFRDFLFLKKVYLFKDIGSDTINAFYPQYVHIIDYLRSEGIPRWSFNQGMGQNIFPFWIRDPFIGIYYLVGRENIAHAIVYVEVFKIVLAGFFFYLYLRMLRVSKYSTILGGLLYSFTGFIILGGGWYGFSYEALLAAALLYSFEKFFQQGIWYLLPICFALIGIFQPFYLILYGLLTLAYATIRFLDERDYSLKNLSLLWMKISGILLLGTALSSVLLFSDMQQLLQSPRVGGEASYFSALLSRPVFELGEPILYISIVSRFFSSDLLGTGNAFKGWYNYLESPLGYCGLACLLLSPLFLSFLDRRRRILYSIPIGMFSIALVFPFFRHLFWGFTGDYFRAFSFYIALMMLFFSLQALSYVDRLSKINGKFLFTSLIVALLVLYLPFYQKNELLDGDLRSVIMAFLVIYTVLIFMMSSREFKLFAQAAFLVVVCFELAYFSRITVNKREVLTSDELRQKSGYNDYTNEATAYLNSLDRSFFRVSKDYHSGPSVHESLNDAKIQNFKGTASYHQFNQKYYIEFLAKMGIIDVGNELETRWAEGLSSRPLLQSFASVKFNLMKKKDNYLMGLGYELLKTFGDVYVLRNQNYLPFGFTYDACILQSDFFRLSPLQKEKVLFKTFVLGDDRKEEFNEFRVLNVSDSTGIYTSDEFGADRRALMQDTLSVSEHSQNRIKGTISLSNRKLLFFSIPYDRGWSAKVDGKEAPAELVNIGFIGLALDKGVHSIELEYFPPYLKAGTIVSSAGILSFVLLLFLTSRKKGQPAVLANTPDETHHHEVKHS